MLARRLEAKDKPRYTVRHVLYSGVIALQRAQLATASLDARILLQHILGLSREALLADEERALSDSEYKAYQLLIEQRIGRKPVSQLIGRREFWGMAFGVTEDTLDPRPDSETLIEAVLSKFRNRSAPLRILDLGTGTGCLLLSLLSEYANATGVGADISEAALKVAQGNAKALGLETRAAFALSRWSETLRQEERFDIVISNPPYIPTGDIAFLEPEVSAHEPHLALDGGYDGLDCYRDIMPLLPRLLAEGGLAVLEIGMGQAREVEKIVAGCRLLVAGVMQDLGGIPRCIVIQAPKRLLNQQPATSN